MEQTHGKAGIVGAIATVAGVVFAVFNIVMVLVGLERVLNGLYLVLFYPPSTPGYAGRRADLLITSLMEGKHLGAAVLFGMVGALGLGLMGNRPWVPRMVRVYLGVAVLWAAVVEPWTFWVRHEVAPVSPNHAAWLHNFLEFGHGPFALIMPPFVSLLHVALGLTAFWLLQQRGADPAEPGEA